jgi:hypothetical protein
MRGRIPALAPQEVRDVQRRLARSERRQDIADLHKTSVTTISRIARNVYGPSLYDTAPPPPVDEKAAVADTLRDMSRMSMKQFLLDYILKSDVVKLGDPGE